MTNPYSYEGRRVVVTGAATGVGAALLDVLADLGARDVTVLDVKPPSAEHRIYVETDLSDEHAVRDAIGAIDGPVHALFNNAGVADTQPPLTVLSVNYLALRTLSEGLLDRMPEGSAIVNTASTAGGQWAMRVQEINELLDVDIVDGWQPSLAWIEEKLPALGQAPYFFSKELVQMYTMRSSRPTIRRGVRTNAVCPSPIDTPLLGDFRATMTDKVIDWNITETNGRCVTAREVAEVLAFLGSSGAAYVNGVNLNVDAGFNAALTTGQCDFAGLA
jgi:NAD(P)-dependent dehydrogenase (short-subunit alcohol dehydrogenase family)